MPPSRSPTAPHRLAARDPALPLRIMVLNVGGVELADHLNTTLNTCTENAVDVALLIETKALSNTTWLPDLKHRLRQLKGGHVIAQPASLAHGDAITTTKQGQAGPARPFSGCGGLAALSFCHKIHLYVVASSALGVLTVGIRAPRHPPFSITLAYVPDKRADSRTAAQPVHGPPSNTAAKQQARSTQAVLAEAERQLQSALTTHGGRALLVGDLNIKLGAFGGRVTRCSTGPKSADDVARQHGLRSMLTRLDMMPVHGRRQQGDKTTTPAGYTSRSVNLPRRGILDNLQLTVDNARDLTEVDYIIGPRNPPAGFQLTAVPVLREDTWPAWVPSTHAPLVADVTLPAAGAAPRREGGRTPPLRVLPFSHEGWGRMATSMRAALRAFKPAPAAGVHLGDHIVAWLNTTATACYRQVLTHPDAQGPLDVPGAAAAAATRAAAQPLVLASVGAVVAPTGAAADPPGDPGQLQPTTARLTPPPRRSPRHYRQAPLPPHALSCIQRAHAALAATQAAKLRGDEVALLAARKAERAAWRRSARAARAANRLWLQNMLRTVEEARIRDPHRLHQFLDAYAPSAGCATSTGPPAIPDESGQPPAEERFTRHLQGLLSAAPTDYATPAAGAPCWEDVPRATPAGSATLLAPVTAAEVARVLLPAACWASPATCGSNSGSCPVCKVDRAEYQRWKAHLSGWRPPAAAGQHGGAAAPAPPTERDPPPAANGRPSVRTSRSPGCNGIPAEVFRWPHTAQPEVPHGGGPPLDPVEQSSSRAADEDYRQLLAELLAQAFNDFLARGRAPVDGHECYTVPLWKTPKEGAPPKNHNRADPDNYRFLTINNILAKTFSLLLTARITHWAIREELISQEQIGFLPHHSCEWHVWTMRETIKDRWRNGQDTYVLFVDLRKAYDSVHLPTLWAVLAHMNMPPLLISCLKDWSEQRFTRLEINGKLSAPIPMRTGVPQGDPLSPILFNLFLESLNRRLQKQLHGVSVWPPLPLPTQSGVLAAHRARLAAAGALHPLTLPDDPGHVRLTHETYADDVGITAASETAACAAAQQTEHWACTWGMALGLGSSKTEVMAFRLTDLKKKVPPPLPPPLKFTSLSTWRTVTIPWTNSYTYLGCKMDTRLSNEAPLAHLHDRLKAAWDRHIERNKVLRRAPPALFLEVFRTLVLGPSIYLLSVLDPNETTLAAIDKFIKEATRRALRLRGCAPREALASNTRLLPAPALVLREQTRLQFQLASPVRVAPTILAAHLFRVLNTRQDDFLRSGARTSPTGIPRSHAAMLAATRPPYAWIREGRIVDTVLQDFLTRRLRPWGAGGLLYGDAPAEAAVHARSVAWTQIAKWAQQRSDAASGRGAPVAPVAPLGTPLSITSLPRQCKPTEHARDLLRTGGILDDPQVLGTRRQCTPLAYSGPGASGCILTHCTSTSITEVRYLLMGTLLEGRVALFLRPWVSPALTCPDTKAAAKAAKRRTDSTPAARKGAPSPSPASSDGTSTSSAGEPAPMVTTVFATIEAWHAAAHSSAPCPLCAGIPLSSLHKPLSTARAARAAEATLQGAPPAPADEPLGPLHVLLRCTHPEVAAARAAMLQSLPSIIASTCLMLERPEYHPRHSSTLPIDMLRADARHKALADSLSTISLDTYDGLFVAYHFLLGRTWSPSCTKDTTPGVPQVLTLALGKLFAATCLPNHAIRKPANRWIAWASRHCTAIIQAWSLAITATAEERAHAEH